MNLALRDCLLATLAYADVFSFPLTAKEVEYWLIGGSQIRLKDLEETLLMVSRSQPGVQYYFLPGRRNIAGLRRERQFLSQTKWKIASSVGKWLKLIPTIKLVGVTGGVAMNNARRDDDVDLFFITAGDTLWVSRLLATILVELLGKRRRPQEEHFQDKVCLNMFMTDGHLALAKDERDLFTAHEVLQMMPLWERDGTYFKFLRANSWVAQFLPNAWKAKYQGVSIKYYGKRSNDFVSLILNTSSIILRLLEPFARLTQLWYMRRRRTSEVIGPGVIRFHPRDARGWIKQKLAVRLLRYNIPLDKVFHGR